MEEFDFLLIYEHKVRELENLCLMKYELDRRGYKTKIVYIDDAKNGMADTPVMHAKVVCTMACYDNYTLFWHVKNFVKFDKVLDLQWENIVYEKDEQREDAYKNFWDIGKEVPHIAWGMQNVRRLKNVAHLEDRNIKLTGHVGMDFLRSPLSRYYTSREELFRKHNLPTDKKVVLFASPYYGDNLPQSYIDGMCRAFGDDWPVYYDFMLRSQEIVLDWFERICKEYPDTVIVFRPHPGHPSSVALKMAEKYENFKVIAQDSVKQWIVACDKIYTGNSSVVVEAFFAQKMCQLLFPLPTTKGFELKLITDSKKITDYEGFKASFLAGEEEFPTPKESIEDIYLIDWETPNYVKFADAAEEILKDNTYTLSKKQIASFREESSKVRFLRRLMKIKPAYAMYLKLIENENIKWSFLEKQRALRAESHRIATEAETSHAHELTSEEEIEKIISRIKYALEGVDDKEN